MCAAGHRATSASASLSKRLVAPALLGLACSFALLWVPSASAHALLVSSKPSNNAVLASSPRRLLLTFTEYPDTRLSHVSILDSRGHVVATPSIKSVAGDQSTVQAILSQRLPRGWYTVTWRTVSAIDGHVANGLFVFGVRVVPPSVSPFGVVLGRTPTLLSALQAAGRWLLYWGLALLVGCASVCLIVLKGTLPSGGRVLARSAWLVAAIGLSVMTLAEEQVVGAPSLMPFFETQTGAAYVTMGTLVLAVCGAAVVLLDVWPNRATLWALGVAAALALGAHTMAGHADAASPYRPLHLVEQWLHMLAVGVWIGGLVWLLVALRRTENLDRPAAVRAFSHLATYALAVVVATGLLRAVTQVGSVRDLLFTSYGRVLLVKVVLVCVIALLGALNHYRHVPAIAAGTGPLRSLQRTVGGEISVAGGILAVTAVMVGLVPAALLSSAGASSGVVVATGSDYAHTVQVRLAVSPGSVGSNTFSADLTAYGGSRPFTAGSVQLQFALPAQPQIGSATLSLARQSAGRWQARGSQLSIAGTWSVSVLIQGATSGVVVPLTLKVAPARGP